MIRLRATAIEANHWIISQPPVSLANKELCVVTTLNANQESLVKLKNAAALGYVGAPNRSTSNS